MVKVLEHHKNAIIKNETPEKSGCIHAGYYKMGGRDQQYIRVSSNLEKYYLTDKNVEALLVYNKRQKDNDTGFSAKFRDIETTETMDALKVGGGGKDDLIKVSPKILVSKEVRTQEAKDIRKTTGTNNFRGKEIEFKESDVMNCLTSGLTNDHYISIGAMRGRGEGWKQQLELSSEETSNSLTSVQTDNLLIENTNIPLNQQILQKYPNLQEGKGSVLFHRKGFATNTQVYNKENVCGTIDTCQGGGREPHTLINYKIRRLTPRECFRLMDFPDSFSWPVSNTQAYKQAGNSIVVNVLAEIINKLNL